jgi:tetratricopeptide (TPR) repeat protein
LLGPSDPEIATSLLNLAALNGRLRRYSEAERFGLEALGIWEKTLGPEHRDVAVCLNNLAMIYWHQKRTDEAIPFARRALAIWDKTVGREHRDYVMGLTNLAGVYCDTGQFEEAETLLKQSIETVERRGGPGPELAWILSNYAYVLRTTKRVAEAKELEQRATAIMNRHAPGPAPVIDLSELLSSRKKGKR